MSTAVKRTPTINEVAERASRQLGLSDPKRVTLALTQVAAQEAERDHLFAERVRSAYAALAPTKQRTKLVTAFDVNLVPIKHIQGREINPAAPLSASFLKYGRHTCA